MRPSTVSAVQAARDPRTGAWHVEHEAFSCHCGNPHDLAGGQVLQAWRLAHRSGTEASWELPGAPPFVPSGLTIVPTAQVPFRALAEDTLSQAAAELRVRRSPIAFFAREGKGKEFDGLASAVPRGIWVACDLDAARMRHVVRHEVFHGKLDQLQQPNDEAACDHFASKGAR